MHTMLQNFLNGNLTTAKKQAQRFTAMAIYLALTDDYGYSGRKAMFTAQWLKGADCWQEACDAD